jgi:hypothetical protein
MAKAFSLRLCATLFCLTFSASQVAQAGCICRCVNGTVEAICQSAIDLKPLCPATLCPLVPPSLKPLEPVGLPPLGTSQCHNQQVWNPATSRYEWRRLCT